MAVLAESARFDGRMGDINVVAGTFSIANNDTWQPGFRQVVWVGITPNASGTTTGYTVSGGTITFKMSGTATCTVMAYGF